jgi:hypothetical protein
LQFDKCGTPASEPRPEEEKTHGVDVEQNSRQQLYARARRFDLEGRSKMSKRELARAIARKQ